MFWALCSGGKIEAQIFNYAEKVKRRNLVPVLTKFLSISALFYRFFFKFRFPSFIPFIFQNTQNY